MLDFTVPSTDRHLPSLSIYSQQLKDLDEWLLMYIATLEQGQSVAVNRGETLSASYLCQQLGRLFTTAEPDMVRGPRIDWMQVVLSQDSLSSNTEEDTYTLGESVVRISTQDMDLISSGRPRQFLTPWPPTPDIQKEVNILSVVADELGDLMRALTSYSFVGRELNTGFSSVAQGHTVTEVPRKPERYSMPRRGDPSTLSSSPISPFATINQYTT
ncbi:unnamed protein product [Penicillium manginii]